MIGIRRDDRVATADRAFHDCHIHHIIVTRFSGQDPTVLALSSLIGSTSHARNSRVRFPGHPARQAAMSTLIRTASAPGWVKQPGVSNPEISDLTYKQPHPRCREHEDFVPGEDLLALRR